VKNALECSVPTSRGDLLHDTVAPATDPDRQGARSMSNDSVQQDMFTVLHGQPAPVVTRWSYSATDPYAVTLSVRTRHDRWVEWLLARDLVVEALEGPTGIGDIRMSPQEVQGYDIVEIEIRSTDGRAVLEVDRDLLRHFVDSTVELVALGDESELMNIDDEITKITQSCAE
jgi:hypothetical protein